MIPMPPDAPGEPERGWLETVRAYEDATAGNDLVLPRSWRGFICKTAALVAAVMGIAYVWYAP